VASGVVRLSEESRWLGGLVAVIVAASIAAFVAGNASGVPVWTVHAAYAAFTLKFAPGALLVMALAMTIRAMACGVREPIAACRSFLARRLGSVDAAAGTLGPILLTPVLMGAFGTFKQMIPLVAPFSWDDTFAEIGRLMFLGHRPWELTHALLGGPRATMIISDIYGAWVPLLFVSVLGFALLAPCYLRARFFVAFCAAWLLLGVVAACLLSSAGPCYAPLIGASAGRDFAPLIARLRAIDAAGYPLSAVRMQDILWDAYAHHRYGFAMGISAMPSMHNSISFLYALSARRAPLPVRVAVYLFAAVILVGSVHLGWHYLADGLFAWAATGAIWWGAGVYLRWCGYVEPAVETAAEPGVETRQELVPAEALQIKRAA